MQEEKKKLVNQARKGDTHSICQTLQKKFIRFVPVCLLYGEAAVEGRRMSVSDGTQSLKIDIR